MVYRIEESQSSATATKPTRVRSRTQHCHLRSTENRNRNNNTIQSLVPAGTQVYSLTEFVQLQAPHFPSLSQVVENSSTIINNTNNNTNNNNNSNNKGSIQQAMTALEQTMVIPSETWPLWNYLEEQKKSMSTTAATRKIKATSILQSRETCEPLSSLVDHVVYTLVQQEHRKKRLYQQQQQQQQQRQLTTWYQKNLLCCGYSMGSDNTTEAGTVSTMPNTSVVLWLWNDSVEFLKGGGGGRAGAASGTGSRLYYGPLLQMWLGDDWTRSLLLHTQLFCPILSSSSSSSSLSVSSPQQIQQQEIAMKTNDTSRSFVFHGNYWQLSGPPLSSSTVAALTNSKNDTTTTTTTNTATCRRGRKRPQHEIREKEEQLQLKRRHRRSLPHKSMSFIPAIGLPKHHVLSIKEMVSSSSALSLEQGQWRAQQMWKSITLMTTATANQQRTLMSPRCLATCQDVIRRHDKCDYARVLERYCPLPSTFSCCRRRRHHGPQSQTIEHDTTTKSKTADGGGGGGGAAAAADGNATASLAQVSASFTPANQVVSFLKSVLVKVFGTDFWGSPHNLNLILNRVECLVGLGGGAIRTGANNPTAMPPTMTLPPGLKVTHIQWLCPSSDAWSRKDHSRAHRLAQLLWTWSWHEYCVPLLQACFHIVANHEFSSFLGQQQQQHYQHQVLLYYRKPVWSLFRSLSMQHLTASTTFSEGERGTSGGRQYQALTVHEAAERLSQQEMGLSRLRLVPKATGVRPIALQSVAVVLAKPKHRHAGTCGRIHTDGRSTAPSTTNNNESSCPDGPTNNNGNNYNGRKEDSDSDQQRKRKKRRRNNSSSKKSKRNDALAKATAVVSGWTPTTNGTLKDAFCVLRKQYQDNPSLFGAGMTGLDYFYPRYRKFIQEFRFGCRHSNKKNNTATVTGGGGGGGGKLCFASVDIQQCYDNINQEKLLSLIEEQLLKENQYMIQRVGVTHVQRGFPVPRKGGSGGGELLSEQQQRQQQCGGMVHREHVKVVTPETFEPCFERVLQQIDNKYHNAVFRGPGSKTSSVVAMSKKRLLGQLREHLQSHLLVSKGRFKEQFFVQSTGIPQGSILSSLLCNLYYGSIVEKTLGLTEDVATNGGKGSNVVAPTDMDHSVSTNAAFKSLLTRMIDDFMFVTQDRSKLCKFLRTMEKGDPELGVQINKQKTRVSVKLDLSRPSSSEAALWRTEDQTSSGEFPQQEQEQEQQNVIKPEGKRRFFPWCGMLFDVVTGEVRVDYSRFHGGRVRDGLTAALTCPAGGEHLSAQLKTFVRPRCLPIFFDPIINTYSVQCINFYQLVFFAAAKLTFLLDAHQGLGYAISNMAHFVQCIDSALSFAWDLIVHRVKVSGNDKKGGQPLFVRGTSTWLGWKAVSDVFVRMQRFESFHQAILKRFTALDAQHSPHALARLVQQARREIKPVKLLGL